MPATGEEGGICPKAYSPSPQQAGGESFYTWSCQGGGGVLHAETAQSALTVIFRLVIGGLTSVILILLGAFNHQFQGPFVPIFFFF